MVLPNDSPYFPPVQYTALAQRTLETGNIIVMGDMNALASVPRLEDDSDTYYEYQGVKDDSGNCLEKTLINNCHNNAMVVVNNIYHNGKQLGGNLSFTRRLTWISETDLCFTKRECNDLIKNVERQ